MVAPAVISRAYALPPKTAGKNTNDKIMVGKIIFCMGRYSRLPASLPKIEKIFFNFNLKQRSRRKNSEQNRTEQNRTEQNRTEQNRTEQNRTEHFSYRKFFTFI